MGNGSHFIVHSTGQGGDLAHLEDKQMSINCCLKQYILFLIDALTNILMVICVSRFSLESQLSRWSQLTRVQFVGSRFSSKHDILTHILYNPKRQQLAYRRVAKQGIVAFN